MDIISMKVGASGAVATSTQPLHLSHDATQWFQWAHGVLVGIGLLVFCLVVVWMAKLLVHGAWDRIVGSEAAEGQEVASAPAVLSGCRCVPPLQMCNGGTECGAVAELSRVVAEFDAAVSHLSSTRAILAEIMARAELRKVPRGTNGGARPVH